MVCFVDLSISVGGHGVLSFHDLLNACRRFYACCMLTFRSPGFCFKFGVCTAVLDEACMVFGWRGGFGEASCGRV